VVSSFSFLSTSSVDFGSGAAKVVSVKIPRTS
jgi:hypothetical protein